MLTIDQLEKAQKAGLLQSGQVQPLFDFLVAKHAEEGVDPEEVHFAKGFHDVFITIGLAILFAGYAVGSGVLFGDSKLGYFLPLLGLMGLIWGLAEWLTKRLRLSLPSLVLAVSFVGASFFTADAAFGLMAHTDKGLLLDSIKNSDAAGRLSLLNIVSALFSLAAGWLFYKRFQVPITPALLLVSTVSLILLAIAAIDVSILRDYLTLWLLGIGLLCFAVAMRFDMRDRKRLTLESDKAFWLHLVAAPLIVHASLYSFTDLSSNIVAAITILVLVSFLGFVALVIDRRAILASALGYLGFAIGTLLDEIALAEAGVITLTLLGLGSIVLMLGSGWSTLRRFIMRPLADTALAQRVPPVS